MANKVLGMHRLKNKVNRNAFDLSHRHMFTAQVGELLPVFSQWVNPNETFKIGYNGKTWQQSAEVSIEVTSKPFSWRYTE